VSLEIARIVYQVLKNHEDFIGRFKNQQLSRRKQSQWPRLASHANTRNPAYPGQR
jgi:hypothetical protein